MLISKTLNNVQTSLIIHGNPFNCEGKDVIICVTGNPGIIDFYTEFGEELHKNTGLAVCVIGKLNYNYVVNCFFLIMAKYVCFYEL